MSLVIIATVYQKSKHVGYRLLDTESRQTNDVTYDSVKSYLAANKPLLNAKLATDKIMGVGCNLTDLSKLDMGKRKVIGQEKYLILERTAGNQLLCTNYGGKVVPISDNDIKEYAKMGKMANLEPLVDTYAKVYKNKEINEKSLVTETKGFTNKVLSQAEAEEINRFKEQQRAESMAKHISAKNTTSNNAPVQPVQQAQPIQPINKPVSTPKEPETSIKFPDIDFSKIGSGNVLVQSEEGNLYGGGIHSKPIIDLKMSSYSEKVNELDPITGFTVNQKLARGVLVLKRIKIFYHSLYASLKKVPVDNPNLISTMGVSLDTLYFNPEFVKELTLAQVPFLLIHEIMHVALKHNLRDKGKNRKLFNVAADLYINKYIADEFGCYPGSGVVELKNDKYRNGIEFASGGLFSPDIDIDKDTVERIYEQLLSELEDNNKKKKQGKSSSGSGSCSGSGESSDGKEQGKTSSIELGDGSTIEVVDITYKGKSIGSILNQDIYETKGDSKLTDEQKTNKANGVIQRAVTTTKLAGEAMDGAIERLILLEMAPKVKWQTLLKMYLAKSSQKVSTYARPDRRFLGRHKILPGPKPVEPDSLSGIKICADTSGSISNKDIGIMAGQVKQLLDTYKADAEMIYWDTSVRATGNFKNLKELLKIKPMGGGGTDINCIFPYFEDKKLCKEPPKVIVVFTDGYFGELNDRYANKYGKKIIWVIPQGDRANFHCKCGKVAVF